MNDVIKDLEKNAFKSFWDDGLLDIMLGLVLLVLGVTWWQNVAVFGAIFPAICVSMWHPLRKRLVEPRMGYVEFSGNRELKVRGFRYGLIAFFTGTMVLGAVIFLLWNTAGDRNNLQWVTAFPLVLIAIPALFFAIFTSCKRFTIYAIFLLLDGVVLVTRGLDPHVGFLAGGALITVTGIILLTRFLSRFPANPAQTHE